MFLRKGESPWQSTMLQARQHKDTSYSLFNCGLWMFDAGSNDFVHVYSPPSQPWTKPAGIPCQTSARDSRELHWCKIPDIRHRQHNVYCNPTALNALNTNSIAILQSLKVGKRRRQPGNQFPPCIHTHQIYLRLRMSRIWSRTRRPIALGLLIMEIII